MASIALLRRVSEETGGRAPAAGVEGDLSLGVIAFSIAIGPLQKHRPPKWGMQRTIQEVPRGDQKTPEVGPLRKAP